MTDEKLFKKYCHYTKRQLNKAFIKACFENNYDLVTFLSNSKKLKNHARVNVKETIYKSNSLKFLFTNLDGHIDPYKTIIIQSQLPKKYSAIELAVEHKNLKLIQYLLSKNAYIDYFLYMSLLSNDENIDIIKLLLREEKLYIDPTFLSKFNDRNNFKYIEQYFEKTKLFNHISLAVKLNKSNNLIKHKI